MKAPRLVAGLAAAGWLFVGTHSISAAEAAPVRFTRAEFRTWLKVQQSLDPTLRWTIEEADALFNGPKKTYTSEDIARFKEDPRPAPAAVPAVKPDGKGGGATSVEVAEKSKKSKDGFQGLHIRSSYDDVLGSEDRSLKAEAASISDLKGATFAYTRDFRSNSNIVAVKGALIAPFRWRVSDLAPGTPGFVLADVGLTPSVSFERIRDGNDSGNDVDSLVFRGGGFLRFSLGTTVPSVLVRSFFRYETDFAFRRKTRVGEFEIEPQIPGLFVGRKVGLLEVPNPEATPTSLKSERTRSILTAFFRFTLHGEFGETHDKVPDPNDPDAPVLNVRRSFGLLGPKMSLTFDPFFDKRLKLSVDYSYYFRLTGRTSNHGIFSLTPEFILNKPADDAKKLDKVLISLKAVYQNGFLDEANPRVHTLMLGLGLTY